MALKLRKDIKKSSYYVWFLGAKESKGLRGSEFILPVIKHLEDREKDVEPFKVTLQVSSKGMKIIQNVISQQSGSKSKPKNETIKHFIPHGTITCCYQREDVIACILLLFNPVTKCPLHVHAYRCDSLETAGLLKQHLQVLIDRPENQKKFAEIENRLLSPKEKKKFDSSVGSDTGTSTRESESSEERFSNDNARVTTLYDSVAAELRAKLCKKDVPILLPPRDYDTVHRQKGNLTGIELRRCLNANIVGQNVVGKNTNITRRIESSGGSSGIGSDHPPSPDSPDANDSRFNTIDNHSTSDEEWNIEQGEVPLYLINQPASNVTLPRPLRNVENLDKCPPELSKTEPFRRYQEQKSPNKSKSAKEEEKILHSKFLFTDNDHARKSIEKFDRFDFEERRKMIKEDVNFNKIFRQDHRKFPSKYPNPEIDDGFDEINRKDYRTQKKGEKKIINQDEERYKSGFYDDEEYEIKKQYQQHQQQYPVAKTRQKYPSHFDDDLINSYERDHRSIRSRCSQDQQRHHQTIERDQHQESDRSSYERYQRSNLTPDNNVSPRDRFRDAKEKFLLLEKDRLEQERKLRQENTSKDLKYHYKREKYFDYDFEYQSDASNIVHPKAAPRRNDFDRSDFERYRNEKFDPKRRSMFNLLEEEHKKNSSEIAKELKRRSYLDGNHSDFTEIHNQRFLDLPESDRFGYGKYPSNLEDEKNESLKYDSKYESKYDAKYDPKYDSKYESKYDSKYDPKYESKYENKYDPKFESKFDSKYDSKFVKNQKGKNSAGYRHSYAEPKLKVENKKKQGHYPEMINNNQYKNGNSSTGRVGIASVHPY
nr:uncharacterized protein LOC111414103 [Onthophagus taurus]XP_022901055.1 uncharacterized protein LOC111414103 [Onthophagus taurus]